MHASKIRLFGVMFSGSLRFTIFICVLLVTLPAMPYLAAAQGLFDAPAVVIEDDEITRANRFFNDCVSKPVFNVSDVTNYENCACASAQLALWEQRAVERNRVASDFLSPVQDDELTEAVLMLDIYAPCLYIPAREMLFDQCALDTYSQFSSQGDPKKLDYLCSCIANDLTRYYEFAAEAFLKLRHSEGRVIYNPFIEVQGNSDFLRQKRETNRKCYADYYSALEGTR